MLDHRFALLGAMVALLGNVGYVVDTFRGRIQPNRVSWTIWALPPFVIFAAEVHQGVGLASALTLACGLGSLAVLIASLRNRYGHYRLVATDLCCGALALLSMAVWALTSDPDLAILLAILTEWLAALPTVLKIYRDPGSEGRVPFLLFTLGGVITVLAIQQWSVASSGFAVHTAVTSATILTMVMLSHRRAATRGSVRTRV